MALLSIPLSIFVPAVGLLVLSWSLIASYFSWSRNTPGPWQAKFTKLWYLWHIRKGDFHWTSIKLHREKGKIVQIMPGYFSIDDPNAHKTIYGLNTKWPKGEWYNVWSLGDDGCTPNIFSVRSVAHHAAMRRKIASMYTMTQLVSYEPFVDQCIELLNNHFAEMASSGKIFDLSLWLQYYAFDVVIMITFGERLGFLSHGTDVHNLIKMNGAAVSVFSYLGLWPGLKPASQQLANFFTKQKELPHEAFCNERIEIARRDEKAADDDGPVCMVKKFIDSQREDNKNGLLDWEISVNAGANIGAGGDTTAISMCAILYYVFSSPRVLEHVRAEIDKFQLPSRPSFQTVQKMSYLQAVIKESLRLHPATGMPLWREVPKGGEVICDQFFPEGTNVGVNSWVANRSRAAFGSDADSFRPERWLDAEGSEDVGNMAASMEGNYTTFGLGSRTCLGKNISLLEINKVIPALIRDYDFAFYSDENGSSAETSADLPSVDRWVVKPGHLYTRMSKRT